MTLRRARAFSRGQARRLALSAQGFGNVAVSKARAEGKQADVQTLRDVMDRLHLLQLDSVPVITRTQYLPVYSRRGDYQANLHDKLAYHHDEWFEAWAHEASLLPVRFEPLLRWNKTRAKRGEIWRSLHQIANDQSAYVKGVLREVHERGPLRARDLTDPRPITSGASWGGGSMGSLALDWLFRVGELGVRRIGNFEKSFDVIERIIPTEILSQPTPPENEAISDLLVLSAQAHGIGTAEDLSDYFRLPIKPARQCLDELVQAKRLAYCEVEGWTKPAYCVPAVSEARAPRTLQARALLSPFDPVMWCRERGERLFDFEYRLEIYTPQHKRRWGYYVLPFLLGDQIVARVDLKNDRQASALRVLAAHLEVGHDTDRVAIALAEELLLLAKFLGCVKVVVGRRGDLINPLRQAVRQAVR